MGVKALHRDGGNGKRGGGGELTNVKIASKSLPETHFLINAL